MKKKRAWGALAAMAMAVGISAVSTDARAADHAEAPGASADPAADINDFYAWVENGKLTVVLTFGGVLGNMNDTNADNTDDRTINIRFGQNANMEWGVKADNINGEMGPVIGAIGGNIDGMGGSKLFAGKTDDPFFFDLQGFQTTLSTSTLSFDNTRDGFAGSNVGAIVIEMPWTDMNAFHIWASSARKK